MKTKLAAVLAACSLGLAMAAQAQVQPPPPGPVRPAEAIKGILDLTPLQLQQLIDLRKAHFEKVRGLRTQIGDLEKKKRELLQSPTPNPAEVGALLIQQQGLQKQVQDAAKAYHDAALALLTEPQKQKVAQIQEALKLAPQAGPLAAFGLIEGPGPGQGRGLFRRFLGGPMPGMEAAPPPPEGAPGGFMMMRGRRL